MTVRVHLKAGSEPAVESRNERRREGVPFRILVMGDFSGHVRRGPARDLADRHIHALDVDTFETVFARLSPRITLEPATRIGELEFRSLDDFHPDVLFARLVHFRDLKGLRERLLDPATFEDAAAALSRGAFRDVGPEDDRALFDRLLGERPDLSPPGSPEAPAARLIAHLVKPYIERGTDPARQRLLLATVDDAIAERVRAILHDPGFRHLESLWRGVHWLVSRLKTDEDLAIGLLDASRAELAADMERARDDPDASALGRLLVECDASTPDEQAWSVLVGTYSFAAQARDLELLAALGRLASHAGAPFLAAADPAVLGCRNLEETPDPASWDRDPEAEAAWRAFRHLPVARWIGLVLPRFLLRLPYGARTDPVEAFAFEELPGAAGPEGLLWGNPALACALLLGQAFRDRGWEMEPGDVLDLDDLPAYTRTGDDGRTLLPCAEILLSDRAAEAILARGLMPLLSYRNRNAARLLRFQSVADPPAALAGPWG